LKGWLGTVSKDGDCGRLVQEHRRLTERRALKAHFSALEETSDEPGVNDARGYACEYVAWLFVTNLSEREAIDFLLFELPPTSSSEDNNSNGNAHIEDHEDTPLLRSSQTEEASYFGTDNVHTSLPASGSQTDEFAAQFEKLSALEIASVSNAKKFLSQRAIQKIINGIWRV
jgi:hypothetical protein